MHGDEFDVVVRYAKWLAFLGDWSYTMALWFNTHLNVVRRWFGMPYWSLSAYLKHKVKRAVNYIGEFETALSQEARRNGAQGVICGHIHHAAMRQLGDVTLHQHRRLGRELHGRRGDRGGHFRDHPLESASGRCSEAQSPRQGARGRRLMRILVATDAWHPQVNGVVRTYERLRRKRRSSAPRSVSSLHPNSGRFRARPIPRSGCRSRRPRMVARRIETVQPDFIHIATEGPIGLMTRQLLPQDEAALHHELPHAISRICRGASADSEILVLRASSAASTTAAPASSWRRLRSKTDLRARGFERMMRWSRGVDLDLYRPRDVRLFGERPSFSMSAASPSRRTSRRFSISICPAGKWWSAAVRNWRSCSAAIPMCCSPAPKKARSWRKPIASADVFVFPSLTDTFGLVLLEALACGVPVAAFPVSGPKDVLTDPGLWRARYRFAEPPPSKALDLDREAARAHALNYSWENSAREFIDNVLTAHHLGLPGAAPPPAAMARADARRKRKRPGWGETGPFHCHASVWGTLWGTLRPPRDG